MKTSLYILGFLLAHTLIASEIQFMPAEDGATVAFEGTTQAGKDIHRFEVRKLGYYSSKYERIIPVAYSGGYYVIYFAGEEYGPEILAQLNQGFAPILKRISDSTIEIYYAVGANSHAKQTWELTGQGANLVSEVSIPETDYPQQQRKSNKS